jgi:hypothetical protein
MDNIYKKNDIFTKGIINDNNNLKINNEFIYNYKNSLDISDIIDNENKLLSTRYNNIQSNEHINSNSIKPSFCLGRGFGNLNISNDIRTGEQSRSDNKEYKKKKESVQLLDYQYQYLNKNYQDPKHLILPIPRGGDMTRKKNYNNLNNNINTNIKFKY